MAKGLRKDIERFVKQLREQGHEVDTESNHYIVRMVDGYQFSVAKTPSSQKTLLNKRAEAIRHGFQYPPPSKKELRSRRRQRKKR